MSLENLRDEMDEAEEYEFDPNRLAQIQRQIQFEAQLIKLAEVVDAITPGVTKLVNALTLEHLANIGDVELAVRMTSAFLDGFMAGGTLGTDITTLVYEHMTETGASDAFIEAYGDRMTWLLAMLGVEVADANDQS